MVAVEAWAVFGAYVIMVLSNILAQKKAFGGKDNKEISDSHPTYLSPDGPTFAIWGLIYLLETVMVVAQFFSVGNDDIFTRQCPITGLSVRLRLMLAFFANAFWLPVFNNEFFWSGLMIMAVYFGFLLSAYADLNVVNTEGVFQRVAYTSGLAMNTSWIVVALMVSVFFCGGVAGWNHVKDDASVAGSVPAAILVVILVAGVGCERAVHACDLSWAFVAAWALRGIYRMQSIPDKVRFPITMLNGTLATCAKLASFTVCGAMVVGAGLAVYSRVAHVKSP